MYLQLALVCDEARMRPDGRMDVTGAFNDLAAPGFPAKQERMVLVTTIEWERGEEGRIPFRVDLLTPGGRPSLTVEGHTDVAERAPGQPPPRTRLILPIEGVIFPEPGRYTFEIRISGRKLRGPSLFLMESDGEPTRSAIRGSAIPPGGSPTASSDL
jgi:hypothetical protein